MAAPFVHFFGRIFRTLFRGPYTQQLGSSNFIAQRVLLFVVGVATGEVNVTKLH